MTTIFMLRIHKKHEPKGLKNYKKEMQGQGKKMTYEDENAFNEYQAYRNEQDENAFMELRKSLLTEQKYICCYCGQRIESVVNTNGVSLMKTEHFYPKKAKFEKYGSLAEEWQSKQLDYQNLLAACKGNENSQMEKHCDTQKKDTPLFYLQNPATESFRPVFRYLIKPNANEVIVRPLKNMANEQKVKDEIEETLNLNENSLKSKRFSAWKNHIENRLGNEKTWNKRRVNDLYVEYTNYKQNEKLLPFHGFLLDYLEQWLSKY